MSSGTQEINEVWNELNQVLLTINKKVFEPLKQELEIANQVFNTVNNTTKLALKEFVFLKRKEEIFLNVNNENKEEENNTKNNKEKIPSSFGEEKKIKLKKQTSTTTENTDPQQKKENSLQALRTIQQKVSSKSISNNTNKPIVSSNPIKTQPSPKPSSKPTVVQKKSTAPITGNSSKQNKASLKTTPSNKSKPSLVTAPTTSSSIKNVKNSKIETEGKRRNLDDILKLARNIRQKEEEEFDEKIVELSCSERKSRIEQNSSNGKSIKEEIKTKVENQSEEENNQKKLPFTTFEQRFDHFSSLLTNIRDLNEKTDESFKKLSSVTGWEIDFNLSFENETVQENLTEQKESNELNKIYTQYLEFIREVCEKTLEKGEVDESDLQEFKGNFVFDEEEMDELEKELLEKTIDKNSSPPPVLSVNTVYNDIPNTYISRWLPKRVNKNITNILVPKVMKKKIDPKRANYNMYYFMFSDPEELRQVIELRYSIQYLLLRKFIYDKLFKEYKLQDYVEKLKHDPNITREYGKLLRILKSIANDRNNTLSRQAIDLTSYYNAKPVTNNDQTNNKDEQEDDNIIEALQYRPVLDWCSFNNN